MSVITREEKTVNNRGRGVRTVTMEMVGANSIDAISAPTGTAIRNVRKSIADGRAILQYDQVDASVGDSYSISGTASQEPLATHPFFQPNGKWAVTDEEWKKWDKWQKEGTDIASLSVQGLSQGFIKFMQLYLRGFTDYLQPRVTVRVTDSSTEEPNLDALGKIAPPASAPDLPEGSNWLLTGVDATVDSDGNWEVTKEYISSGPGGWNPDIYGQ